MNSKLEMLNLAATKQEHVTGLPMSLKISLNGAWRTLIIDRDDKILQRLARAMVLAMLRNEIEATSNEVAICKATLKNGIEADNATLNDYVVEVSGVEVTVRAHSKRDACVMASILKGDVPEYATPEQICKMADKCTRVVSERTMSSG